MPNPNLTDAALEAGGAVYGRAAITDKFVDILSVSSGGTVRVGNGLSSVSLAGVRYASGLGTLDGSNPTPITTGLTTVTAFIPALIGTSAPGTGTSTLTVGAITGGSVDVYAWKPTSNANPTLIASTGTETFYWFAVGT